MNTFKIKKIIKASIPDLSDISLLLRGLAIVGIIGTFGYLLYYSAGQVSAQSGDETVKTVDQAALPGLLRGIESAANGSVATAKNGGVEGSNLAETIGGAPYNDANAIAGNEGGANQPGQGSIREINYGATGRLINSTSSLYQTQIASPSYMPQYYAERAKGTVLAADPTSGTSVLQPVFFLSNAMRNLAYGLIVILLVVSSFSILLGYLAGGEQKVTLVQLMLNTFVTLLLITFFYQISAMVYDLTVNYGNMLVASIMEPFINAKVILERLGPGGDLNITAMTNVFEFAGIGSALNTVAGNVMMGARPAITQSLYGVNDAVTGGFGSVGAVFGWMNSFSTGTVGIGINAVLSGVLGSQALFDAVIAWVVFFVNLKIFGNLIYSFIAFNMYVGFGPLLMLQTVNQGVGKAKDIFKTLFAYGMTFPVTFLFILLGATAMNFYYKQGDLGDQNAGSTADRANTPLCTFQTNDPQNGEYSLTDHVGIKDSNDSPLSFRKEHTEYQDIFDTRSAPVTDPAQAGLRSCRSSLFALPFTFFPAPLGNYGNRLVQVQTTDILVRTAMAIMFLVIASRAPDILKELLQVEEMKSLQGLGGAFKAGLQPVLAIGGVGVGVATGMTFKALRMGGGFAGSALSNISFSRNGRVGRTLQTGRDRYRERLQNRTNNADPNRMSLGEFWGGLGVDNNIARGQLKAEALRKTVADWQLNKDNKASDNVYYHPYTGATATITNPTDARLRGVEVGDDGKERPGVKWRKMKGEVDPDTGESFGPSYDAAYNWGKQYADPVIGAQMQGWMTIMGDAANVTKSAADALTAFEGAVISVTKQIQAMSREILAENF